ncbi:D-alanyl-D-alanine carboxypeptidase/D-alanyl-D-alanine endopeptidase [Sphingomonas sp.]|jgi:D-alanyl-D-alanine carboxypeptidase/D-alanyl-D-alanine-endopeptidase (penicillin-binding protein 4)|uniref:D-alanyl-D-alanine carboxypeptidase/D-alanyl-D-alanine endopeptidase n=1 Tax=Sphingomonas sp. TaxID=28214 RepID=UPI002EDA046B
MRHAFLLVLALAAATPAAAQDLRAQVRAKLAEAAPGTRFGLMVASEDGTEIVAIDPYGRYIPASNTKMFSTAVAFATMPDVNAPDEAGGNAVRIDGRDVVLIGNGDARMSSAGDCKVDCLAALADAVAAKTKRVRDVIGDDTRMPDERWSPGMSWNNIPTRSGTGVSALTADDNEVELVVAPGEPGKAGKVTLGSTYYTVDNLTLTVEGAETRIGYDRLPFERVVRVTGTIGKEAKPDISRMGIDDPAHFAAWRFKTLLEERGVKVKGQVRTFHRTLMPGDDPARREGPFAGSSDVPVLARLTPAPLAEDLKVINKISQNLHAELTLRRVSLLKGSGSIADGMTEVEAMLAKAGVARTAWDLSDGSGMSSYNRVSPRGVVQMLRWISGQSWGAQWRETLPIGGVDGTLRNRFKGTPLEGKVFAKTGTLNATNALAGYMIAASGKTLVFAFYANDMPASGSATKFMDAALIVIAAAN